MTNVGFENDTTVANSSDATDQLPVTATAAPVEEYVEEVRATIIDGTAVEVTDVLETKAERKARERAEREADAAMQNCFTVGFDPKEGTVVSLPGIMLDVTLDKKDRQRTSIGCGRRFIGRASGFGDGQPCGFMYHMVHGARVLLSGELEFVEPEDRPSFYVLRRPAEKPNYAIVKIDLSIPGVDDVRNGGGDKTLAGIACDGEVLMHFRGMVNDRMVDQAVVMVGEGEALAVMFTNGMTYTYVYREGELSAGNSTDVDKAAMRAGEAHRQLQHALAHKDGERRDKTVNFVLRSAVAFVNMDIHHPARCVFIKEFFLKIEEGLLEKIRGYLWKVLSEKDMSARALLSNRQGEGIARDLKFLRPSGPSPLRSRESKPGLTPAQRAVKKADRAERDRELRREMQGSSQGGGNKQKSGGKN